MQNIKDCVNDRCDSNKDFALHSISLMAGIFAFLAGVVGFTQTIKELATFHVCFILFFLTCSGLLIIILEFKWPIQVVEKIRFYHTVLGRGITFLLLGCLPIDRGSVLTIFGFVILFCSMIFIILFLYNIILDKKEEIPPPIMITTYGTHNFGDEDLAEMTKSLNENLLAVMESPILDDLPYNQIKKIHETCQNLEIELDRRKNLAVQKGKEDTCEICFDKPIEVTLDPCGHRRYCESCANKTLQDIGTCPHCREAIVKVIKNY